jgi:hypothetical protein
VPGMAGWQDETIMSWSLECFMADWFAGCVWALPWHWSYFGQA